MVYFCINMKETKSDRTKKFILKQVAPIFNKKGYVGTALSDMERATGLTKGAIYGNFGSKDQLASACFEYNLRLLQRGVYKAVSTKGGSYAQLTALLEFYEQHYDEVAAMGGCPLLNTSTESDDTIPSLHKKVQQRITNWKNELNAIVRSGQANGTVQPTLDVERFSTTFIAMIEGGIMLAKAMEDKKYFHHAITSIDRMIEDELKIK